jgi:hypothetical protein
MGADQRQQGTEIAPLPNSNRQHELGQLLGERHDTRRSPENPGVPLRGFLFHGSGALWP